MKRGKEWDGWLSCWRGWSHQPKQQQWRGEKQTLKKRLTETRRKEDGTEEGCEWIWSTKAEGRDRRQLKGLLGLIKVFNNIIIYKIKRAGGEGQMWIIVTSWSCVQYDDKHVHYLQDQMTGRPSSPVLMETLDRPGTSPTERQPGRTNTQTGRNKRETVRACACQHEEV